MAMIRLAAAIAIAIVLHFGALAAHAQETTVVPKRVIYPGEAIDATMLSRVNFVPRPSLTTPIAMTPQDLEGKVARRTLLPGRLIPLSFVRDAYMVEPGKPVNVIYVHGALTISVTGVPLQPGSVGDLIRVRNVDSGAVLLGTVMSDGTVRVGTT